MPNKGAGYLVSDVVSHGVADKGQKIFLTIRFDSGREANLLFPENIVVIAINRLRTAAGQAMAIRAGNNPDDVKAGEVRLTTPVRMTRFEGGMSVDRKQGTLALVFEDQTSIDIALDLNTARKLRGIIDTVLSQLTQTAEGRSH